MSETDLASKKCVPCSGDVPRLRGEAVAALSGQVPRWQVVEEHHLERVVFFPDFKAALAFTNAVGEVAEREGHHPDLRLSWGKVAGTIWTHKIDGLSEADFVLAAKIDRLPGAG